MIRIPVTPRRTLTDPSSCTFLASPGASACAILPPLQNMAKSKSKSISIDWIRRVLSPTLHPLCLHLPEITVEPRVWKDKRHKSCPSKPKLGAEVQGRPSGTFITSSPLPTVSLSAILAFDLHGHTDVNISESRGDCLLLCLRTHRCRCIQLLELFRPDADR